MHSVQSVVFALIIKRYYYDITWHWSDDGWHKQNLTPLCTFTHAVHNRVARCVGSRGCDFHKSSLNTGQCKLEYLSWS
jgi:hypothetical protein